MEAHFARTCRLCRRLPAATAAGDPSLLAAALRRAHLEVGAVRCAAKADMARALKVKRKLGEAGGSGKAFAL